MAKLDLRKSIKHVQIDKANSTVLIAAASTAAIVVFSLIAFSSLYKQMSYQNKVISLRNKANNQLKTNIKSVETLMSSYQTFENSAESVIGTPDKNSKVILDALPSKYDFPALATSLEYLVKSSGAIPTSISGTDNEATAEQDSIKPKPIEIPIQITATGSYSTIQKLINDIQRSIRPIKINSVAITGTDTTMNVSITATTYYQPEKKLDFQQTTVPGPNTKNTKASSGAKNE